MIGVGVAADVDIFRHKLYNFLIVSCNMNTKFSQSIAESIVHNSLFMINENIFRNKIHAQRIKSTQRSMQVIYNFCITIGCGVFGLH